jgi:hypothetical protein
MYKAEELHKPHSYKLRQAALENSLSFIPSHAIFCYLGLLYHWSQLRGDADLQSSGGTTLPSFPLARPVFPGKQFVPQSSPCHVLPSRTISLFTTDIRSLRTEW